MSGLRIALVSCLMLGILNVGFARPDNGKIDKTKLVGTWTYVKTTSKKALPPGYSLKYSFTKDGKVNGIGSFKNETFKVNGTYSVKDNQLTTTLKGPDGAEEKVTVTISELTDKKFVTTEKENGKTVTTEFKK